MSLRRKTDRRLTLIRKCGVCGKEFVTSASSPWMRQMYNVDGKKQKTTYFCSQTCYGNSYINRSWFDGKTEERKAYRDSMRDQREKNKKYYEEHKEQLRELARERYWSDPEKYRDRNRYNKKKRKILDMEV